MKLGDLLDETQVRIFPEPALKEEIITAMVDLLPASRNPAVREEILRGVREREGIETTGLGHGVAFPHGIAAVGSAVHIALGIARQPVDFQSLDGEPVRLVFMLVGSEENREVQLKVLARASRLLRQPAVREALVQARDAAQVMRLLREAESED